ncbi:DUF3592 domain-containing protein [Saccharopolyspora rectivirgula]|uniref:DUF3592 domain-containing protein n=1 Tax=Saccharopolyspora rectivirgula TaxID=28042 RepID=UPI001F302FB5|nr:DUF3592 domain-containing protein [Saccharopolyspora rectivirgula]
MATGTTEQEVTGPADSADGPEPDVRARVREIAARCVLGLGTLLTIMAVALVVACSINDRTIEEARGEAVAEVIDTSLTRTAVWFATEDGRVYNPPNGVLYPSGLQQGQLVRVEYDARNPDLVRVAGRNVGVALLPVFSSLAVCWGVLLPAYWLLRRPSRTR